MKILTITCHDVYNAGASLQAYALQSFLSGMGCDVSVIDYKPDYLRGHYKLLRVSNPKYGKNRFVKAAYLCAKLPERLISLKRKRRFDLFRKKYLRLTERFSSYNQLEASPPAAGLYIAGSDQIWNPLFPNGRDPAFYLAFVKTGRKASYAASFAVDAFPDELADRTAGYLKRFDALSVRESSGLKILRGMGIDDARVDVDPVFLLGADRWSELCIPPDRSKPYIFVCDFDGNSSVEETAKKLAAERGLKIYSLFKCGYADRCLRFAGPREFVGAVKNAAFVLSNSFHATAFSVIFEREFLTFGRREAINTRMRDFLTEIGAADRLLSLPAEEAPKEIDWIKIHAALDKKIEQSKEYLRRITKPDAN